LLNAWRSILTKAAEILSVQTNTIFPDGDVLLSRVELTEKDAPVPEQFLSFLSTDLAQHPERPQTIDASLVQRIRSLVGGVDVDLNTALSPTSTLEP
jgi:antitoxin PrlF